MRHLPRPFFREPSATLSIPSSPRPSAKLGLTNIHPIIEVVSKEEEEEEEEEEEGSLDLASRIFDSARNPRISCSLVLKASSFHIPSSPRDMLVGND